jgi:hypothetical protein
MFFPDTEASLNGVTRSLITLVICAGTTDSVIEFDSIYDLESTHPNLSGSDTLALIRSSVHESYPTLVFTGIAMKSARVRA